jgi:hypothetical protein
MLDIRRNHLRSLPDEISSLVSLKELKFGSNHISEPPISILRHLTALTIIDMDCQYPTPGEAVFSVPSSLLPILHLGLVQLHLRPGTAWFRWDSGSLVHLEHAARVLAERGPVPRLLFEGPLCRIYSNLKF